MPAVLAAVAAGLLSPATARAHAFGARYDLPLPLDLYLVGAGAAVALSFVVMALAFRGRPSEEALRGADLTALPSVRALLHPWALGGLRLISVGLFALVLAAGWFGNPETIRNFAPSFVWIIWWVGFAYLAALIGNPWPLVNPWAILFQWAEAAWRRASGGRAFGLDLSYPAWLGAWPAVALFIAFAWFELIAPQARTPAALACAITAYSLITWAGMWLFGRRAWLAGGEAFALAFDVFGKFAPLGGGEHPAEAPGRGPLYLRPYAAALVATTPCRLAMTAFVLTLLATVTFDGFKETPVWGALLRGIAASPALHPLIRAVHDLGFDLQSVLGSVMLVLFPALFLTVYLIFAWATKLAASSPRPVIEVAGWFVLTLVPIAIAYHLAHYLFYLVLAGQYIIPLLSDPFGAGWDLFGTAGYKVDITLIGAKFVWYAAVVSIVAGHVIAVGVAHFTALAVFDGPRAALRSQLPLLLLMVGYTMVSLWILAQPIVGAGDVAGLRANADRVRLAPFEFRERCFVMTAGDSLTYRYTSDRRLAFDIHYHDGLKVRIAARANTDNLPERRFRAASNRTYCLFWSNETLEPATLDYRITPPRR